jgi:NAD-dependent SIR2 family protein deacetylase
LKAQRYQTDDTDRKIFGMKLRCPACNNEYEDEGKERLITLNQWLHNVCPACYIAYLKTRVRTGERLDMHHLNQLGKVRKKLRPGS